MNRRFYFVISTLTASALAITGMSFLLAPGSQLDLIGQWRPEIGAALGGLFFLVALAYAIPMSLPVAVQTNRFIQVLVIGATTLLFWLYIKSGLIVEGGVAGFLLVANAVNLYFEVRDKNIKDRLLMAILAGLNIVCGLVLIMKIQEFNIDFFLIESAGPLFGWVYLLTGLLSLVASNSRYKENQILFHLPLIPWIAWCVIFIATFSLSRIILPLSLVVILSSGETFPWDRLALPRDDIVGHRIVLVMSTTLLVMVGVISGLLYVVEKTLTPAEVASIQTFRLAIFGLYLILSTLMLYGVSTIIITINGLTKELTSSFGTTLLSFEADPTEVSWNKRISRFLNPLSLTRTGLQARLDAQASQINILSMQLNQQKRQNTQLVLLGELSQQLEVQLEQPVAAQLVVNALEHAVGCDIVCVYTHEIERHELVVLASAGRNANVIPWGYRQDISQGVLGRAIRQRKTQVVMNSTLDPDFFVLNNEKNLSTVVVLLIHNGYIHGVLELSDAKESAFSSSDVALAESVAAELTRSWARSNYYVKLTELIESGASLSSMISPQETIRQIASITRNTLGARFIYAKIQPGQEKTYIYSATSGLAPKLLESIEKDVDSNAVLKLALHASQPFRIRDISKNPSTSHLEVDQRSLRSLIVIPVRLHRLSVGLILAFGKQEEVFFTEEDESLARLISTQAAGAFESTWLQDELRTTLTTTSLLYQLSNKILQAQELQDAAFYIAQTAQRLSVESETGIVLFYPDGQVEAEVGVDTSGVRRTSSHPMALIDQTMQQGKTIYVSQDQVSAQVCIPIQTPLRKYGVLWVKIPDERSPRAGKTPDLQTLANQAALALERSVYLAESRRQAEELKVAYSELELTYDRTLVALMSSLDARDRETEGHSTRVSQLAAELGRAMDLDAPELKALERGALLHDIGKIGVSDTILHKPGPLSEAEWKLMKLHPEIGARIVEGIPFLQETLPLIRHHQERWDGSGYPYGLRGDAIPLLARIFSIIDAFDALTTERPYREKITPAEAIDYIHENAGILFDPDIVSIFESVIDRDLSV